MSWVHLEDTTPKARRAHRCELCGMMIPAGVIHAKRSGVVDGGFVGSRYHIECLKFADKTFDEDTWQNYDEAEFRNDMAEMQKKEAAQ